MAMMMQKHACLARPASQRPAPFQGLAVGQARAPVSGGRTARPSVAVYSTVLKDDTSGAEFNVAQQFWVGDVMRCLGSGTRQKQILMLKVKVYSVAAYFEAERCAKELGVRERGGFFSNDGDFCSALLDGAFHKALLVRLVRDVEGQQFADAINDTLMARMTLAGELDKLQQFTKLFDDKKLTNGTEVVLVWNLAGSLDVLVSPPGADRDYGKAKPEISIQSVGLSRGLFEVFLGENSVVADARKTWAAGARNLLESENVKRASRKAGSG